MSGGLDAERWRLVELLQVRALKMFLAGPDGHRLETVDGRIQPMSWRYVPDHAWPKIRAACEAAEERLFNRPIPEKYRALFEEDAT